MACVHQIDLETTLFQDLVERNPIDASRLHGYRLHPTTLQPVGHTVQISGKTFKSAYGLWVSVRSHGNVMRAVPQSETLLLPSVRKNREISAWSQSGLQRRPVGVAHVRRMVFEALLEVVNFGAQCLQL